MSTSLFRHFLVIIFLFAVSNTMAQGDLLITPKRLIFDGSKRVEEINLANIGKDTATYNISFIQFKMDDNGNFIVINEDDSTHKFAHKNLRFFPRTVTLAPNEAQSVKVQLLRANELVPGEYRSHLFFKNVYDKTALGEEKPADSKETNISVNIKPVFGISIATIIRVGQTNVEANFTNTKLTAGSQNAETVLNFTLTRAGNISLYGDVQVKYIGADNISSQVAVMKGLAVYTPNASRKVQLPLKNIPGFNYNSGKLLLEYSNPSAKNAIITSTEILL